MCKSHTCHTCPNFHCVNLTLSHTCSTLAKLHKCEQSVRFTQHKSWESVRSLPVLLSLSPATTLHTKTEVCRKHAADASSSSVRSRRRKLAQPPVHQRRLALQLGHLALHVRLQPLARRRKLEQPGRGSRRRREGCGEGLFVAIDVIPYHIPSTAASSLAAPRSRTPEETRVPWRLSWSNADRQRCRFNIILLLAMGTRNMVLCCRLREVELLALSTAGCRRPPPPHCKYRPTISVT